MKPDGEPWLVGEEGPELIFPQMAGTVVPAGETSQMLNGNTGSDPALAAQLQSVASRLDSLTSALATARPIYISEAERGPRTAEDVIRMARRDVLMVGA